MKVLAESRREQLLAPDGWPTSTPPSTDDLMTLGLVVRDGQAFETPIGSALLKSPAQRWTELERPRTVEDWSGPVTRWEGATPAEDRQARLEAAAVALEVADTED